MTAATQPDVPGAEADGTRRRGASPVSTAALALVGVAALVLLAAFAIQIRQPATGPRPGAPAPDFALETFDGRTIRLSALRGHPVIVNFWASWCVECAHEAADIEALWQEYRDRGVMVLGVDYTDTRPAALAYLAEHGITYPNGPDRGGAISRAYRLTGVPETVVVDPAGNVVPLAIGGRGAVPLAKIIGPVTLTAAFTPADLRALLDELLAQQVDP